MFAVIMFLFPKTSLARENVTDWYIKNFDSQIVVNKNSSLDITETITADCGTGIDKHGIFRILPTQLDIAGKKVQTPVQLLSIANEKGQGYQYSTTKNSANGTVTWKIGDAKTSVHGVNVYIIHYRVKNAIRFANQNFDELYWNLNGNFWDLQIDKFHATIKFPEEITQQNATVDYYTGSTGSKENSLAAYKWNASNVLEFDSTKTLFQKQGITASIIFPKNILTAYVPNFWESYGEYFFFLIPVFVFVIVFSLWRKYGKDPVVNKTIIAQYEIPENLSPIEAGMLMKGGGYNKSFITAEIIWLASRGLITIKEIENKILFFSSKDYELIRNRKPEIEALLNDPQKLILESVFSGLDSVLISNLKEYFYTKIKSIWKVGKNNLQNKGLIMITGINICVGLYVLSMFSFAFAIIALNNYTFLGVNLLLSGLIMLIFGVFMPQKTVRGAELDWQIKGFKLFMETVDKDRAAFYEKENIFEKCLPYAILFGMTKLWIKKIQEIYGSEYFTNYTPLWYVGNLTSFNADSFASTINDLSSDISSSTSAPSGSGGAGSSGGGGGGGGGGGW